MAVATAGATLTGVLFDNFGRWAQWFSYPSFNLRSTLLSKFLSVVFQAQRLRFVLLGRSTCCFKPVLGVLPIGHRRANGTYFATWDPRYSTCACAATVDVRYMAGQSFSASLWHKNAVGGGTEVFTLPPST